LSKDPRQRIAFVEIAYGKVPNEIKMDDKTLEIIVNYANKPDVPGVT